MQKLFSKPKDYNRLPNLLEKGITSCVYIDLNEKYSDSKNYVPKFVGLRKANPEVTDKEFHDVYLDVLYHYRKGDVSKRKKVVCKNLRKNGKSGIIVPPEITDKLERKRYYLREWKRINYTPTNANTPKPVNNFYPGCPTYIDDPNIVAPIFERHYPEQVVTEGVYDIILLP